MNDPLGLHQIFLNQPFFGITLKTLQPDFQRLEVYSESSQISNMKEFSDFKRTLNFKPLTIFVKCSVLNI